jgi:pimeloyl-ACP methyl ester carboxylesterase
MQASKPSSAKPPAVVQHEHFIRSFDGTQLFVTDVGSGLPMVLCDGLGCRGFIWQAFTPHFSPHYRLIHGHYRGHGQSQPPQNLDSTSVADLAADLLLILDYFEIEKAVLVGHSMGVQLVLDFAVRHPERVLGLVPMCGSYGQPLSTLHDMDLADRVFPYVRDMAMTFPSLAQRLWRRVVYSELAYQYSLRFEVNPRLVRRSTFWPYFEHLAAMDVQVFVRMLSRLNEHSVEEDLHRIEAPVLVVGGEDDRFTPVWLSERLWRLLPNAELLIVPSGTHTAPIEVPELVHLRFERFLQERVLPLLQGKNATPKPAPADTEASAAPQPSRKKNGGKTATRTAKPRAIKAKPVAADQPRPRKRKSKPVGQPSQAALATDATTKSRS